MEKKTTIILIGDLIGQIDYISLFLESICDFEVSHYDSFDEFFQKSAKKNNNYHSIFSLFSKIDQKEINLIIDFAKTNGEIPVYVNDDHLDISYENLYIVNFSTLEGAQKAESFFTSHKNKNAYFNLYAKLSIESIHKMENIKEDVYVQLTSGRLVKIFGKDDMIEDEDLEKYKNRGVRFLYFKRNIAKWIYKEVNNNYDDFVRGGNVTLSDENRPGSTQDEHLEKINEIFSVDRSFVEGLNKAIRKTITVLSSNPKLRSLLKHMNVNKNSDNYFNDHIALLCNISCGILKLFDDYKVKDFEKFVIASYMHDITLVEKQILAKYQDLDEVKKDKDIGPKDKKEFEFHPHDAAELVEKIMGYGNEVATIVRQHHERPNGNGFPDHINAERIGLSSAIFIISHDFVNYIMDNEKWTLLNFINDRSEEYSKSIFKKIIGLLRDSLDE